MALELIITSVRKGLDGGSGYQPVLRTKDLKPAIAERLQLRSGYSHPFPHGDRRNPVVFVHRIERVAGETLHVIARICDAGSDHTGRSNFLAHFVAMSDAEARKKAAGPAEVTRRMAFKTTWDEPAREAGPPTVVGGDRQPGACRAWEAAGLDPGIAGDLAAAAMAGREVTLVSRETDDVLALFADAMALVSPIKRWQVSFNTCRIEPFEGTWQAIRADLPHAKEARSLAGVIDLTANPRGGDGPYAAYARGNATALPWQEAANPVASLGERTGEKVRGGQTPPVEARASGSSRPPAAVMAPASPGAPPRPKRRPGIDRREELPSPKASDGIATGRLLLWLALAMIVIAPLAFGLTVLLRPELLPAWAKGTSVAVLPPETSNGPLPSEDRGDSERLRREREEKKRAEQSHREQEEQKKKDAEEIARAAEKELARQKEQQRQAAAQASADAEKAEANRKKAAFEALKKLPEIVPKDLVSYDGEEPRKGPDVELGPLAIDQLLNFEFALATPKEDIEGKLFTARIESLPGDSKKWKVMSTSQAVDGSQQPLPLAKLEARAGKLYISAADENAIKNPRFNLLRCSVLLVKASDPEQPTSTPCIQKRIQLVKPGEGRLQWELSLLDESREEKIPRPQGGKLPKLTSTAYTVRVDYPRKYTDGKPLAQPEVYKFDAAMFCPLFDCPPPNPSRPTEVPVVGLDVSVNLEKARINFKPEVRGEGAVEISQWARLVHQTDRQFATYLEKESDTRNQWLTALEKMSAARFRNSDDLQKKIMHFVESNDRTLEEFFEEKKLFPAPTNEKGEPVNDNKTRFQRWSEKWRSIETTGADPKDEWQKEFVKRLREFLPFYGQRERDSKEKLRAALAALKGSVRVEVTGVVCPAYDQEGNQYKVNLSLPGKTNPTDIN
jgi:hypothetical protein